MSSTRPAVPPGIAVYRGREPAFAVRPAGPVRAQLIALSAQALTQVPTLGPISSPSVSCGPEVTLRSPGWPWLAAPRLLLAPGLPPLRAPPGTSNAVGLRTPLVRLSDAVDCCAGPDPRLEELDGVLALGQQAAVRHRTRGEAGLLALDGLDVLLHRLRVVDRHPLFQSVRGHGLVDVHVGDDLACRGPGGHHASAYMAKSSIAIKEFGGRNKNWKPLALRPPGRSTGHQLWRAVLGVGVGVDVAFVLTVATLNALAKVSEWMSGQW